MAVKEDSPGVFKPDLEFPGEICSLLHLIGIAFQHEAEDLPLDFKEGGVGLAEIIVVNLPVVKTVGAVVELLVGELICNKPDDGRMEQDVGIGAEDILALCPADRHILGDKLEQWNGLPYDGIDK